MRPAGVGPSWPEGPGPGGREAAAAPRVRRGGKGGGGPEPGGPFPHSPSSQCHISSLTQAIRFKDDLCLPSSLPPLARLAHPPRAPSSPPRPARRPARSQRLGPARRDGSGVGHACSQAVGPQPRTPGARCPRAAGRGAWTRAAGRPAERLRGDPGQRGTRPRAEELVTPPRAARQPRRASRSFLKPRPTAAQLPAKLSLSSSYSLSPSSPLCLCQLGGRDWDS